MIDWMILMLMLRNAGYTTHRVANDLHMGYQHLLRLSLGEVNEPRYNSGVKLLRYASDKLTAEQMEQIKDATSSKTDPAFECGRTQSNRNSLRKRNFSSA